MMVLPQQFAILSILKQCNEIDENAIKWIDDALNRRPDALDYFLELSLLFKDYLNESDKYLKCLKLYKAQKELEKLKVFFFKQRKILLAVPQRKRHPKFPAPNLGGLVVPQNFRLKGEVCYGMNYSDARSWLVEKALEDDEITDILFVDDDILLPLDAINRLCDSNEMIIGANYIKKQWPIESCALRVSSTDDKWLFHNAEIKPEQGYMEPIRVSQMGLGCCLIRKEVFEKLSRPWFAFMYNKDGSVFRSEDVKFCQDATIAGFIPKIIPGLVPIHVDFKTGKYWGPEWLTENYKIKKEFEDKYCYMQCNPKECFANNI